MSAEDDIMVQAIRSKNRQIERMLEHNHRAARLHDSSSDEDQDASDMHEEPGMLWR